MISSSKNCKGDKRIICRPSVYLQPISGKFLVSQIKIKEVDDFLLYLTCRYVVLEITIDHALVIFQPISAFAIGQPKSILVGQISCTFSMGQQSVTYKISYL